MIKRIQKYLYYVLVSLLLLSILLVIIIKVDNFSLGFSLVHDGYTAQIEIQDSGDGNYSVYLPSYATLNELQISMTPGTDVSLGGITISNAMPCDIFQLETPYELVIDGEHIAQLQFYQSGNVKTMYINTVTGSMDRVHEKLGVSETAVMTLISSDGKCEYVDDCISIKGRGNATWGYDKRPYTLTLSQNAALAAMPPASKWILLANATDETNLNNKLILDMANHAGLNWSPSCIYVDVYLNGSYNGLYLLTEKVEVGSNRLNIDTDSGDFLCKVDLEERQFRLTNPFQTDGGRTIEISSPIVLTAERKSEIQTTVNQLEQTILSNTDLRFVPDFDLDSWVKRYIIDEISGNIDSDMASSYFHYTDGVFYAGPVWDYDMTLGNHMRNQASNSFIAKNAQKSDSKFSPWYSALYANKSFYNRTIELYQTTFLPILKQMIQSDILALTTEIQAASRMNSVRWKSMYTNLQAMNPNTVHTTEDLIKYLEEKMDFLASAWIDRTEFCTLQFEVFQDDCYWNISVEKGSLLETTYLDLNESSWINSETGETVDFSKPITTDMILTQRFEDAASQQIDAYIEEEEIDFAYYVTYLSIGVLLIFLFGFVFIDFRQMRKERSTVHASEQRHISA